MSDVAFRCLYVPDGFAFRAQRQAVLYPLATPAKTPHGIEIATNKLVEMWRARLAALQDYDWSPRGDKTAMPLVRNCRPPFYQAQPALWCCRLTVCPFCYARRVGDVWEIVERVFHQPSAAPKWYPADDDNVLPTADNPARCRLRLVERSISYRVPLFGKSEDSVTRLQRFLPGIAKKRAAAFRESQAAGGWQQTTIEPSCGEWRVRTRQLLVYREDDMIPPQIVEPQRGRRLQVHDLPSRSVLLGAVSRACRYPTLWLRGDPKLTALLFQSLHESRARLTATFGAFRGVTL